VSLYLLALDDVLEKEVLVAAREKLALFEQGIADGSMKELMLALSSGVLSPTGIADDNDGLAPVTSCPPAVLGN
jgi:hypothetical protein